MEDRKNQERKNASQGDNREKGGQENKEEMKKDQDRQNMERKGRSQEEMR